MMRSGGKGRVTGGWWGGHETAVEEEAEEECRRARG